MAHNVLRRFNCTPQLPVLQTLSPHSQLIYTLPFKPGSLTPSCSIACPSVKSLAPCPSTRRQPLHPLPHTCSSFPPALHPHMLSPGPGSLNPRGITPTQKVKFVPAAAPPAAATPNLHYSSGLDLSKVIALITPLTTPAVACQYSHLPNPFPLRPHQSPPSCSLACPNPPPPSAKYKQHPTPPHAHLGCLKPRGHRYRERPRFPFPC